jgi:hypothetical protein
MIGRVVVSLRDEDILTSLDVGFCDIGLIIKCPNDQFFARVMRGYGSERRYAAEERSQRLRKSRR